jgi:uncharacterized membrane protein YgdD (TMEM256/DUF423 family)
MVAGLNRTLAAGALLSGTAVALGAMGAHALKLHLLPNELDWWRTAVQFQMWHGLALVALGAGKVPLRWPPRLLGGGAVLFSTTLYAMALGGPRWLGAVTPLGGLLMLAGWASLAAAALRTPAPPDKGPAPDPGPA